MSTEQILTNLADYLDKSSFIMDFIRGIGWGFVFFLKVILDAIQSLFDAVYNTVTFTNSSQITGFISQFKPIVTAVLTVALLIIGTMYLISEHRPAILKNILIFFAVVLVMPQMIGRLNTIVLTAKDEILSNGTVASNIIKANVADILYMAENGYDVNLAEKNNIDTSLIEWIDVSAHVESDSSDCPEPYRYYINVSNSGSMEVVEFDDKGWFDFFDPPWYYRYHIDWVQIIFSIIIFIFVILFASYKAFRIIWEILVGQILATLLSGEIASGQKVRKILEYILNAYITLIMLIIIFQLYNLFQTWLSGTDYNVFVRLFLLLFAGLAVIDGPNLCERILGIDAGLQDGSRLLFSAVRTVQSATMMKNMKNQSENSSSTRDLQSGIESDAAQEPSFVSQDSQSNPNSYSKRQENEAEQRNFSQEPPANSSFAVDQASQNPSQNSTEPQDTGQNMADIPEPDFAGKTFSSEPLNDSDQNRSNISEPHVEETTASPNDSSENKKGEEIHTKNTPIQSADSTKEPAIQPKADAGTFTEPRSSDVSDKTNSDEIQNPAIEPDSSGSSITDTANTLTEPSSEPDSVSINTSDSTGLADTESSGTMAKEPIPSSEISSDNATKDFSDIPEPSSDLPAAQENSSAQTNSEPDAVSGMPASAGSSAAQEASHVQPGSGSEAVSGTPVSAGSSAAQEASHVQPGSGSKVESGTPVSTGSSAAQESSQAQEEPTNRTQSKFPGRPKRGTRKKKGET